MQCFRPVSSKGSPIIGLVSNEQLGEDLTDNSGSSGVYLAVGHGPWGVSNSLGTGLVMSELIEGKTPSANVEPLGLTR